MAPHSRDLLAWHGLCALGMLLTALVALPASLAYAVAALFTAGLGWCLLRVVRRTSTAAYVRLGVCCLAMVVMVLVRPGAGHHGMAMDMNMDMGVVQLPRPVLLALGAALVVVVVVAVTHLLRRRATPRARASSAVEGLLAAAMAVMVVSMA